MLHGQRAGLGAYLRKEQVALVAVGVEYAYLDELVDFQAALDLGEHAGRQACFADHGNGMEAVGAGAQFASLRWAE